MSEVKSSIFEEERIVVKRRPVVLSGVALAVMSFQTLGIVYSDLATSPIYTLNGIWPSHQPVPPPEDVIGGLSAIFWALTIVPLIKYVIICLRFGTQEGEGGTFALFQGLYPEDQVDDCDDESIVVRGRHWLDKVKWPLRIWSLFGTALTLSDGIFTSAVSVTSAVEGISVAKPHVLADITPISIAFLVSLFLAQRFGTGRISMAFAPVTFLWLALVGITGIMNIVQYPGVCRAFDPSRAIFWFVRTKRIDYLAGVLLAVTGSEAMYANLGQLNALSIQLSFSLFVYPCLVLGYFGQGARIIVDGEAVMNNIFFKTIPGENGGGLYWVVFVVSIVTAVIASQALITATFSLTQQLINFKSFPPLTLIYTSDLVQGRVYIPAANYLLCAATIIVVAAFKNVENITNAYGFSVATVFIVTSSLLAIQIYCVKRMSIILSLAFFVFFGFVDALFWGASLKKVPHGAWVSLAIGLTLTLLMIFWTWARGLEEDFDGTNRRNLHDFLIPNNVSSDAGLVSDDTGDTGGSPGLQLRRVSITHRRPTLPGITEDGELRRDSLTFIDDESGTEIELIRLATCAIFHNLSSGNSIPHAFYGFLRQLPALPELIIFLSVRTASTAHIEPDNRYRLVKVPSLRGFYYVTYSVGFRDHFNPSTDNIIKFVSEAEARADPANAPRLIARVKWFASRTTHIIPHYFVSSRTTGNESAIFQNVRKFLIEEIYRSLSTMFPGTDNWKLDNEDVLRVGVNALI